MNKNFDLFLTEVLKHEGGYVNHPKDAGGPTNKGITLVNFRKFVKADGTVEDLKKITNEQAGIVYRHNYWDAVLGAELPSGLDLATGDYAVNSGPARPIKALQKIVGVTQDGRIGPVTLKAIKDRSAKDLVNALCDQRLAFMKVAKNTRTGELLWPTFGKGWQRRVDDIREKSLSLVEAKTIPVLPIQPEPIATTEPANPTGKLIALLVAVGGAIVTAALKFFGIL